ncbi:MFS transporter [Bacillus carboniphilus]|uniref:MFS transporter n=1 Tax=Bacillus carboniphilus TaxID=86663 RepID=A0ABP3FSD3_9BACI
MNSIKSYIEVIKVRNVFLLSLMTFFYSLTFYTTVFTLFLLERGLNYFEIFLLESVLSASIFLFEIPSGALADRFGRKKVIVLSMILFAISTYIVAVSHSFLWFVVESILYGIGVAAMSGADSAMIYESLKKKELADHSFSLISSAASLAMIVSLPLGGMMAAVSLELPVYITCISLTVAVLVALFLRETQVSDEDKPVKKSIRHSLGYVFKEHPFLFYFQCIQSVASGFIFSLWYLNQPLFLEYNIELKFFGWIMLAVNLCITLFVLIAPTIRKKIGSLMVFLLTILLPGVSFILIALQPGWIAGLLLFGLAFIIHSINGPIYRTFINERIPDQDRATTLSIISFVGSVVGMVIKPLIGWMADFSLEATFMVMGVVMVVGALVVPMIIGKLRAI